MFTDLPMPWRRRTPLRFFRRPYADEDMMTLPNQQQFLTLTIQRRQERLDLWSQFAKRCLDCIQQATSLHLAAASDLFSSSPNTVASFLTAQRPQEGMAAVVEGMHVHAHQLSSYTQELYSIWFNVQVDIHKTLQADFKGTRQHALAWADWVTTDKSLTAAKGASGTR